MSQIQTMTIDIHEPPVEAVAALTLSDGDVKLPRQDIAARFPGNTDV